MPSTTTVSPDTVSPDTVGSVTPSFAARWVSRLSWMNLGLMMAISWLLFAISENWWFSSAMTYAPRIPYLVPAIVLLLASGLWHRSSIIVNLISIAVVAVPIMGLALPVGQWLGSTPAAAAPSGGTVLKVVSCNVQDFRPDFEAVITEIGKFNPDVVAFQDARSQSKLLSKFFSKWHTVHEGEYFVASRYPVTLVKLGHFESFDRDAIMQCELELPTTRVSFFNVHQMTPRHGLRELDLSSPITQRGSTQLTHYLELRAEEAGAVRAFVEENRGPFPTILVGDFNMPCESSLYQRHWFGYQNAFNVAGTGYGYSFPCTRQYCWPAGLPWMRLDHILADDAWNIRSCKVGQSNGSDHRPITATIELR